MNSREPGETYPSTRQSHAPMKVGYVRRAHGIKGAVIVRAVDDETPRFIPGELLSSDNIDYPELTIVAAHPHKDGLLVDFAEVSDRNQAEVLRGTSLLIDRAARRALDDDEFWPEQLLGLPVCDPDGNSLGSIVDIEIGGSQDRLVVSVGEATIEVPFVKAIVTAVDLEQGLVVVDAPPGLFAD